MAKITLTQTEAYEIIRKHLNIGDDFQIEITDVQIDDGWIDVPIDWDRNHAPDKAFDFGMIDVMFRNGQIENCHSMDYHSFWCQDGCECEIIKYRKAK